MKRYPEFVQLSSAEFTPAMRQRSSITKGGQIDPPAAPSPTPQQNMDLVSAQRGNGRTGRR
ncbi:MAG TPA: hypothetical protein VGO47_01925, partial [Chlamydiales bacterium]|nr:hypothetical protein [Chlamydiales bacterium]